MELRTLVREDGFAMVTVIGIMVVSLAFASAAALASISSLRGTVRDEDSKAALAAADAGAALALSRQNTQAAGTSTNCLQVGTNGMLASVSKPAGGWCAPVSGTIDGAGYTYQVNTAGDGSMRIVSVGTSDGVSRRIELSASNTTSTQVFNGAGLIGLTGITMSANSRVEANAASNGSISLSSIARLCGNAQVGIGGSLHATGNSGQGGSSCPQSTYTTTQSELALPNVQQGTAATANDNGRFFSQDLIGGPASGVSWNSGTRTLKLLANSSLTLGGNTYSFCRLELASNSALYIAAGAQVRIYFDSPEACGIGAGQSQLVMSSNSTLRSTSGNSTHLSMLFVGSAAIQTNLQLNANAQPNSDCSSHFVIYAPRTDITVDSNVTYCGAMAGRSVSLASNSVIRSRTDAADFSLPVTSTRFVPKRFVECTVRTPGVTGSGC